MPAGAVHDEAQDVVCTGALNWTIVMSPLVVVLGAQIAGSKRIFETATDWALEFLDEVFRLHTRKSYVPELTEEMDTDGELVGEVTLCVVALFQLDADESLY